MLIEFSNAKSILGSFVNNHILKILTFVWLTLVGFPTTVMASDNVYVGEVRNITPASLRPLMSAVSTEAFLSKIVYDRSIRELGKTFYFDYADASKTSYKTATLIKYESNSTSGFTGAIFETSDNRIFIVFGGTFAQDVDNQSEKLIDVIADIQLLSYDVLAGQVSDTTEFMIQARDYISAIKDEFGNNKYDWKNDVIITGHSLGGGLAQYAGMMSNLTTVTFNTAPAPITPRAFAAMQPYFEYEYCANCGPNTDQTQIVNIFSNDDPLTIVLQAVEAVEYGVAKTNSGSYLCSELTCTTEEDLAYLKKYKKFEWLYERLSNQLENSFVWRLIDSSTSFAELTTDVLIGGLALSTAIAADLDRIAFMRAVLALKSGDIHGFTEKLKDTYSIAADFDMKSLIIGDRYEINTNSFHSMFDLIKQSYKHTDDFNLLPIQQNLPEFYSYIDGSYFRSDEFTQNGMTLPVGSNVDDDNLASRIAYYYYFNSAHSYEDLLYQEKSMHWDAFNFYEVSHEKIDAFASTYLNIGGLATQVGVLAADTMSNVSDEELNLKTKKKIVSGVLSSGKSTIQDVLPKEVKDISDILDDCLRLSWIPIDDIVNSGLTKVVGKEIKKTASTIVNCALGQTVKGTSRTYSAIAGRHHIKKWQHKSVAKVYLDEYFRCGFDNDACMAAKFGNHQSYQDQIHHIITTNQLDQGIDLLVAAGAHDIISEYIYDITNLTNEVLNLIPESKHQAFQFASRVTNTLDYNVELLSLADNEGDELTLSFQVNNTSGRDLIVYDLELIVITESGTRFYSLSDHPDVLAKLLKAYSANTSSMPVTIVLNFNETNLASGSLSEARIVTELRYGSGFDNIIDDRVQRIFDFNPQNFISESDVNTEPTYTENGDIAETMLEITLPEGEGRVIQSANSSSYNFTALANDKISLRYLVGTESSSAEAQCWEQPFLAEGDTIEQRYLVLVNEDTGDELGVDFIIENDCATASFTLPTSGTWSLKQYGYRYTQASDPTNVLVENFGFNTANNIIAGDPNRFEDGGGDTGQPYNDQAVHLSELAGYAIVLSEPGTDLAVKFNANGSSQSMIFSDGEMVNDLLLGDWGVTNNGIDLDIYDLGQLRIEAGADGVLELDEVVQVNGNPLPVSDIIPDYSTPFLNITGHKVSVYHHNFSSVTSYQFNDDMTLLVADEGSPSDTPYSGIWRYYNSNSWIIYSFDNGNSWRAFTSSVNGDLGFRTRVDGDFKGNLVKVEKIGGTEDPVDTSIQFVSENLPDYSYVTGAINKYWTFNNGATAHSGVKAVVTAADSGTGLSVGDEISIGDVSANSRFNLNVNTTISATSIIQHAEFELRDGDDSLIEISNSETNKIGLKIRTNRPPQFAPGQLFDLAGPANTDLSLPLAGTDADGDSLTFAIENGIGNIVDDTLIVNVSDEQSLHSVTVSVSDGKETKTQDVTVRVVDHNTILNFYTDITDSTPYRDAILFATLQGLLIGSSADGGVTRQFEPDRQPTWPEVLAMLLRTASYTGDIEILTDNLLKAPGAFPQWVDAYYTTARLLGIIDQNVDLAATPTNQDIARMIVKLLKLDSKIADVSAAIWLPDFDAEVCVSGSSQSCFNDANDLYSAQLTRFFGLFMQDLSVNPQGLVNRGKLADVMARMVSMPRFKLSLNGDGSEIEAGDNGTVLLSELTAPISQQDGQLILSPQQQPSATQHTQLNQIYINAVAQLGGAMEFIPGFNFSTLNLNAGENLITVLVENRINNTVHVENLSFNVVQTDSDLDGVQDRLDKWPNDSRYFADANNNNIPDSLDSKWNLYAADDLTLVYLNGESTGYTYGHAIAYDLEIDGLDDDFDGVYDHLDTHPNDPNRSSPVDSDNDGLTDEDEIIRGTNPFNADSDGDGFSDFEEVSWGTSPIDRGDSPATSRSLPIWLLKLAK